MDSTPMPLATAMVSGQLIDVVAFSDDLDALLWATTPSGDRIPVRDADGKHMTRQALIHVMTPSSPSMSMGVSRG